MGTFRTRKDIPPWVKIPEDLKDPEVFRVQTLVLKFLFGEWQVLSRLPSSGSGSGSLAWTAHFLSPTGPHGSRIPHFEKVSQAMFELKTLESSELTEVLVYGSYNHKLRAKWMLQSMAERYRLRQERGETPTKAHASTMLTSLLPSPLPACPEG